MFKKIAFTTILLIFSSSIANAEAIATVTAGTGVIEPISLSSVADTIGEAVDLFDFTVSDGGGADAMSTDVTQIVIHTSGTADFSKVTWRLNGAGASDVVGTYDSSTNTLTFSTLSISVADGASEIYTVSGFFSTPTGLTDNATYILSVDGDTDLTLDASKTQMGSTDYVSNGTGTKVDITATKLVFATTPSNVIDAPATVTAPTLVKYTDSTIQVTAGTFTDSDGVRNLTVKLYRDKSLTNLVGTDANGAFAALESSLSYQVVTSGEAKNATTGEWEVKVSSVLEITTDATVPIFQSGDSWKGQIYNTVTSPYTSKIWLDRNLGASQVCTALDDVNCYGDYYQWGRNTDGHQVSNSSTQGVFATQINPVQSVLNATFVTTSEDPHDWVASGVDDDGSIRAANWSKTDGSSVCPVGFRVPSIGEIEAETTNVTTIATAFSNFLKLPSTGNRLNYDSSINNPGTAVGMWLSSPAYLFAVSDRFGASSYQSARPSHAMTVRCIKESTTP